MNITDWIIAVAALAIALDRVDLWIGQVRAFAPSQGGARWTRQLKG